MLHVRIQNDEQGIEWEGEAHSVSSENSQGQFDILPEHAYFVTIIKKKEIVITGGDGIEKKILPTLAVLSVKENNVNIYSIAEDK